METLLFVGYYGSALVNLVCIIIVVIALASEKGALHAFFGFCCCQIYAFFWGWLAWKSDYKMIVMLLWTIAVVVGGLCGYKLEEMGLISSDY